MTASKNGQLMVGARSILGIRRAIRSVVIALGVSLFAWSCSSTSTQVAKQFQRYAEASASHDLETLEALTSENIVWYLGPYRFVGKDAALGPNAYDRGMQSTLLFRSVSLVDDNVVECEVVERSELVRAIGMTELRSYPRYTFEEGLVARKEPSGQQPPDEYSMAEFTRRMVPLRGWIRDNHPEAIAKLVDSNGAFLFSEGNGALMLRLAREWVAAGAPGRLTTQWS